MSDLSTESASVLQLTLQGKLVGYIAGYDNTRNVVTFDHDFINDPDRPTLSLITHPNFPRSDKAMIKPWVRTQRLHPLFSNLLPEGSLRGLIAQWLKVHPENEFALFSALGADLPGALVATPMPPEQVPDSALAGFAKVNPVTLTSGVLDNKFSLAGVQMKFSVKARDGRYNLSHPGELGDWIVKTPSTHHAYVPLNEYSAMSLAAMAGVDIPEIRLVEMDKLDKLPQINLPDEQFAFAIKRFDRENSRRIHMEDFAQILVKYPHEKYGSANYEQIGAIIYRYSGDPFKDIQQFARRVLVNALLANGDAHLKNWSLVYPDQMTPRLSPAYDIVTTRAYMKNETDFALNINKNKNWYQLSWRQFEAWAGRIGVPWQAIKGELEDVLERARDLWPNALQSLPMMEAHQATLRAHWQSLHNDYKII